MVVGWKQSYPGTCQITCHIPGYVLSQFPLDKRQTTVSSFVANSGGFHF